MHVDRAVKDVIVAVARFIEKRLAGFYAALGLGEAGEQIEFDRRKHERLGAEHGGAGVEVHAQLAHDDFFRWRLDSGDGRGVEGAPAEDSAEAGEEFAGGKRFRQVVIGADLEADDAVRLVTAGGEHEHGHGGFQTDALKDLKAVEAGVHHIENNGVRRGGAGGRGALDAFGAAVDGRDGKAERLQVGGDEATELFVVIDHQNAREPGRGGVGRHRGQVWVGGPVPCNCRGLNKGLTIPVVESHHGLTPVNESGSMRFVFLLLLSALSATAAELALEFELRWRGAAISVPSTELVGAEGRSLRVTRWAALVSGVTLARADGGLVRLDGQYGFVDAAADRMRVALRNVPTGEYVGIEFQLGLPTAVNHADPAQWPAGHPLNPIVNGLHWGWAGGYVFAAIEGRWRAASAAEERGFSYHLATDERLMTVGFNAQLEVTGPTKVRLALDLGKVLGAHVLRADDDSETTHSGRDDALAVKLARAMERAWFFLEAGRTAGAGAEAERQEKASAPQPGTPLAFSVPAGFPQPELPADNPLTEEGVELGRRLFGDRRLSARDTQSCATCHRAEQAFSDGRAMSIGADGKAGTRNSMPLFNLAWSPSYAWDGSKPRLRDQALAALTSVVEMHGEPKVVEAELGRDPRVRADFAAAFGTPEVTVERIGRALEQFMLTLIAADSKFDRALRGEAVLNADEKKGFELFSTEYDPVRGKRGADCFHCHGGTLFTDFGFRDNGLGATHGDAARSGVTGRATDAGKFKTPSLRNVALTAPYMHDGRLGTLEDVVAHYDHGVSRTATLDPNLAKHPDAGLQLTTEEQRALVAFLRTLTEDEPRPLPARPTGPRVED